jgi:hypothetical protein
MTGAQVTCDRTGEWNAVKGVLAFLVILVVAAACSFGEELQNPGDPVGMTSSTLTGTWHGGTQRFITFRADGSFSATNLPTPPFQDFLSSIGFDSSRQRVDGSGTWALERSRGQSVGPQSTVHLRFAELAGVPTTFDGPDLSALRPGDGKVYLVFFYVGDQGNSSTGYLKCGSDCIVPGPVASSTSSVPSPGTT